VTPQGVLVWTLALPQTADDTARWLDTMTDALAEHGPTSLTWR
jgi:hypothetical protein